MRDDLLVHLDVLSLRRIMGTVGIVVAACCHSRIAALWRPLVGVLAPVACGFRRSVVAVLVVAVLEALELALGRVVVVAEAGGAGGRTVVL